MLNKDEAESTSKEAMVLRVQSDMMNTKKTVSYPIKKH
jgi:hypothetical protein